MNNYREDYENLFAFLRNSDLVGTRLNLDYDNVMNYYTFEGKTATNKFIIDISDDSVSLSFLKPEPNTEQRIVTLLNTFLDKDLDVSYVVKDINDPEREISVYEWVKNKERIKKIEDSEIVSYPHYITGVSINEKNILGKPKNR